MNVCWERYGFQNFGSNAILKVFSSLFASVFVQNGAVNPVSSQ